MKRYSVIVLVALLATLMWCGCAPSQAATCGLAGEWVRDDHAERILLYRSHARWFGELVWSSEIGVRPGLVLRNFMYHNGTRQFVGTVAARYSGVRATGELACLGDDRITLTEHRLLSSETNTFTKVAR